MECYEIIVKNFSLSKWMSSLERHRTILSLRAHTTITKSNITAPFAEIHSGLNIDYNEAAIRNITVLPCFLVTVVMEINVLKGYIA